MFQARLSLELASVIVLEFALMFTFHSAADGRLSSMNALDLYTNLVVVYIYMYRYKAIYIYTHMLHYI